MLPCCVRSVNFTVMSAFNIHLVLSPNTVILLKLYVVTILIIFVFHIGKFLYT